MKISVTGFQYEIDAFERANKNNDVEIHFLEPPLDENTALLAKDHDGVCIFVNDQADAATLERLQKLDIKFIALRCAGFNNVDLTKASELGIKVARVPAYSPEAVAEFAVGLMLTSIRKYHKSYARVRDGNFTLTGLEGYNLHGKTIGLIGTGKIGLHTGRILARGFQARVIAFDPVHNEAAAADAGVQYLETMEQVLEESDIISLHLPLNDKTRYIIDEKAIARMKDGAVLINTSRGPLIDTKALVQALKSAKFSSVALDVYDGEEGYFYRDSSDRVIQDDLLSRLMSFHNVFISGHQAFLTREALQGIAETTLQNVKQLAKGEECGNIVKE